MSKKNDSVFQLSLTEIAFTIVFLLLILLGFAVVSEQAQRKELETKLAAAGGLEGKTAALTEARAALASAVKEIGTSNPDEAISRLVNAAAARQEVQRLRARIDDLDAQLSTLTTVKAELLNAASGSKDRVSREQAEAAIEVYGRVLKAKDAITKASTPGVPSKAMSPTEWLESAKSLDAEMRKSLGADTEKDVRQVVTDAKAYRELGRTEGSGDIRKENSDLRGQVAFLRNKLARGGLDFPPCWAEESGKVEFLFNIEMREGAYLVSPGWPPNREKDARALPGIADLISGQVIVASDFPRRVQPIFELSRKADPQCRYYVQIKSVITDAVQSDRARLLVENFFYKSEVRR